MLGGDPPYMSQGHVRMGTSKVVTDRGTVELNYQPRPLRFLMRKWVMLMLLESICEKHMTGWKLQII